MKLIYIALAAFVASAAVAFAGSTDHGKRLAGPFCINKNTGVVRSVALLNTGHCRTNEWRRFGQPDNDNVGVAAPVPGPAGATGPQGATGPTGATGAKGDKGDKGANGLPGKNGTDGTNGEQGPKGDTGATGPAGPQGAKGDVGPAGADGANGKDGTNGLGDGTRWFCEDGNGHHVLSDGGTGDKPDCNEGTTLAFQVVTVGSPIVNP